MKQAAIFAGLMALGLILVVAVGGVTGLVTPAAAVARPGAGLDLGSLAIGLALGLALAGMTSIRWSELPRRIVGWLIANTRGFKLAGWAGLFLAVLLFY